MRAWTRWQDWVNTVLGAWLFVTPWVLTAQTDATTSWFSWVTGAVIAVASLLALAVPSWAVALAWVNGVLGLWSFLAPWILGFAAAGTTAWNAWVVGVLVLAVALSTMPWEQREVTTSTGAQA